MRKKKTDRYLVTIFAEDKVRFRALGEYDFDLFAAASHKKEGEEAITYSTDGVLDFDQIDLLVRKGYEVRIRESASRREAAPVPIIDAQTWMEEAERNFNQTHKKIK